MAFSPSGKRAVSGGWDNSVRVWQLPDEIVAVPLNVPQVNHPLPGMPIDLLNKIQPATDVIRGSWSIQGGELLCAQTRNRLQLPLVPPTDYDLKLKVRRMHGDDCLSIGLTAAGRQFSVVLDGYGGRISGISNIDGKGFSENETRFDGPPLLKQDTTVLVICRVRSDQLTVEVDGRNVVRWSQLQRLSLNAGDETSEPLALALGSYNTGFQFSEISFVPIAGEAKQLR